MLPKDPPSCARCAELRTGRPPDSGPAGMPDRGTRQSGSMTGRDSLACGAGVFDLSKEFEHTRLLDRTGEFLAAAGPPSVQNRAIWRRVLTRERPQCHGAFTPV